MHIVFAKATSRARIGRQVVTVAALALLALGHAGGAGAQQVPPVPLKPSPVPFDHACQELTQYRYQATNKFPAWQIDKEWAADLSARLPEFQADWDAEAPALMGTALSIVGRPFPHREMIATATLCAVNSMSNPLIINMRPFLIGPTQGKPRDKTLFASLVFHELLHTYLVAHRPQTTPLLQEHKAVFDKSMIARNHVHLFALMQLVYERLGRAEHLQQIIASETSGPDAGYRQAWDLVRSIGADRLVAEMKAL